MEPAQEWTNEHAWGSVWQCEELLHSAVYAGAPAAQEAFRAAKDLLEDKFE